jgi:N-acetyl-anhydromuramyl-L-alanine amidase AmpD/cell division protein FtsB
MTRPLYDSPYLYGIHDPGGEHLMAAGGARGWILFTEALGSDPNDTRGVDYSRWANEGYGIMVRLNNGYEPNGTIPHSSRYADFSRRVANFVKASKGCRIWIIGNETNFAVERPGVALDWSSNPPRIVQTGEVITPELYARCYTLCRNAIKQLPGRDKDQVITGAVAPWNTHTTYPGNPSGDWVKYQTDILAALGPNGCDGVSIHAYTHGADPALIHTNTMMNPPFANRQYNFRVYQDFMRGIPANMRHLPVYLTETDQDEAWQNVNRGWIQRAYGEIDWWNRQPDTQVIRAVILYRWPNLDRWGLESKTALHEDFRQALVHRYNWEAAMQAKPQIKPQPEPQPQPQQLTEVKPPAIADIAAQLSRDGAKFIKRARADVKYVVINHTAVRPEIGADRVAIAQRRRWPGIMSQYYITGDSKIQRTNPDDEVVSRDQGWIFNGINIYVAGNFDNGTPPEAQLAALAHLCAWLLDAYDLKADALRGASEFVETHSPGLTWNQGPKWKETLVKLVAAVPGSPTAPQDAIIAELRALVKRLEDTVAGLTEQVNKLTAEKTALNGQVQTLQAQSAGLLLQVRNLTDANNTLKNQLAASEADRQALRKKVAELEARIAELTQQPTIAPPAIRDITATLPRHATNKYSTRALSAITTLAIHHSAASGEIPPQNVASYHVRRDWPGIGYHFYIMSDGTIYQCNRLETISYHVGYANDYTVGICLAGRFMDGATPPEAQLAAATHLAAYLLQKLNVKPENIRGHKELPQTATACPGSDWLEGKRWKDKFAQQVRARLG